jgi:Type I phosphodiesterase / nucleotide pyrophosphatase
MILKRRVRMFERIRSQWKSQTSHRAYIESLLLTIAVLAVLGTFLPKSFAGDNSNPNGHPNVIIFVTDGLRAGSVNPQDTPALWSLRSRGVHFANSHSLFPTFTTANASAIATGHGLGDTGDFANRLWIGYPVFDTGNFGRPAGTATPGIENDQVLADLADHYGANYLGETTLLTTANKNGYSVAAVGKLGPTAIQEIEALSLSEHQFPIARSTVIIDDRTGTPAGIPLPASITDAIKQANLSPKELIDSANPNARLEWLIDIVTRVLLPAFQKDPTKPFLLFVWCPEPDATQHGQEDSLGELSPGINGASSRLAVRNADKGLGRILSWLKENPAIQSRTDIFVTADHGFATISRREINRAGEKTTSPSAQHRYLDSDGKVDSEKGTLPNGFLAMDVALALHTNLFDPDTRSPAGSAVPYHQVKLGPDIFERPAGGDGFLGQEVRKLDGSDAEAIIAANGGSDLIYVPDKNLETVRRIVAAVASFDYSGAIFVDDQFGEIPGALPLSSIGLVGSSAVPRPAIVVGFKAFYWKPTDLQSAVQISDTSLAEGQGMHGGFGRDSTFNNMAAIGPDFKAAFEDATPVSNADIAPTIAHILGFDLPARGKLTGRVIEEALRGSKEQPVFRARQVASSSANGRKTILQFQESGRVRYYDRACFIETRGMHDSRCP